MFRPFFPDSVFLLLQPGDKEPPADGALGNLKDEIESDHPGEDVYISAFYATGPKSYSYDLCDRSGRLIKTVSKIKGISLTSAALEQLAECGVEGVARDGRVISFTQRQFVKNLNHQTIKIVESSKTFAFSSTKRRMVKDSPHLDTLPHGYNARGSLEKINELEDLLDMAMLDSI